jgi:hypothetical protein
VILLDANLLIYAHVVEMPHHEKARTWLDGRLNDTPRVGFPWSSLLAFVRLISNPKIFDRPLSVVGAWDQVEAWLSASNAWVPQPTPRHQEVLARLLRSAAGMRSNLVNDAHLAALAMEHGLTLCSADGDFARFEGLRWENPVAVGA